MKNSYVFALFFTAASVYLLDLFINILNTILSLHLTFGLSSLTALHMYLI